MSRTPETITNKPALIFRNILIGLGIFFALAALGGFQNGGAVFFPALLSVGSFFIAAKLKVHWHKDVEVSRYR